MLKSIINPDIYHGKNKKDNFFEGWYFKLVHPRRNLTYCFIPGIFLSSNNQYSHSFIQMIKGHDNEFNYFKFEKDELKASEAEFNVCVKENFFSLNKLILSIDQRDEKISGTLFFKNIIKWPDSIINPGSMGFYNYLTFMQCYSQVCAVDGYIEGSLNINGEEVDFTGGKIYIEKNWGKAFPYSYIWVQGNSFERGDGGITCSIGHVPFLFSSFTGFLIGLYVNNKFYKFTTINNSTLSIGYEKHKMLLQSDNKEYTLKIEVLYKEQTFMDLYAPRDDNMVPIARESLQGDLTVTLFDRSRHCIIFSDTCNSAGIEFSGNYRSLSNKIKRT